MARTNKSMSEQVRELPPIIDNEKVLANMASARDQMDALNTPQHGEAIELFTPDVDQVRDSIKLGMELIAEAFRAESAYTKTREALDTGEVTDETVVVNTLAFQQKRVLGSVIWGIDNAIKWIDDTRNDYGRPSLLADLRKTLQRQERGAHVDDALNAINAQLDRADMAEAECRLRSQMARDAYLEITGREYVAPGQRRAPASTPAPSEPAPQVSEAVAKARARLGR